MKSHPFDLVSFLPGVLSVAIAVVALAGGLTVDVLSTDWVWPSVLILLGVLVLATAGMGRRTPAQVPPPEPATSGTTESGGAEPAPAPTDDAGEGDRAP